MKRRQLYRRQKGRRYPAVLRRSLEKLEKKFRAMNIIEKWTERDLSAQARKGTLEPAYEVDELLGQINGIIAAKSCPLLIGESGVGKTAVIHEWARRSSDRKSILPFGGRRIMQVSLARQNHACENRYKVAEEMQTFVQAIGKAPRKYIVFISDLHVAYDLDLEHQLGQLLCAMPGAVVAEGPTPFVDRLFEYDTDLRQQFTCIPIREPKAAKTLRIARQWASETTRDRRRMIDDAAIEQAFYLSHRFLSRTRQPGKTLNLLSDALARSNDGATITSQDVIARFCDVHRTPRNIVDPVLPLDLDAVEASLTDTIVGQPDAVRAAIDIVASIKSGTTDVQRPLSVCLFAGPSGVGKTYLAQLIAKQLFGDSDNIVRVNMADHATGSGLSLFGDPSAELPTQKLGTLSTRAAGQSFGVLLLDEFEKAAIAVQDRFLQLVDEGTFINGAGELVSFRSMIIIATTNSGAEAHYGAGVGFVPDGDRSEERVRHAMTQSMRPELLNRFDRIVHFAPLTRDDACQIVRGLLIRLGERPGLRRTKVKLEFTADLVDHLVDIGFDVTRGARTLRHVVEQHVVPAIAKALVRRPAATAVRVVLQGGQIVAASRPDVGSVDRAAAVATSANPPPVSPRSRRMTH